MIARKFTSGIGASMVFGLGASAFAGGVDFTGGSFMTFSNAVSAGGTNTIANGATRGSSSTTTFGIGAPVPNNNPNVFTFNGRNLFTAQDNVEFVIGDVTYFNGITSPGPQSVQGALNVIFDAPAGLPQQAFNFLFDFEITLNDTGDPVLDADILNFTSPAFPNVVNVNGINYTLAITGFQLPSGGSVTGLELPEGQTARADVTAVFIVPSPGASALLGLGGLVAFRRRR